MDLEAAKIDGAAGRRQRGVGTQTGRETAIDGEGRGRL